jgi:hypothetical protein
MPDFKTSELENMPRPRTAPTKPTVHIPVRAKSFTEASSAFDRDDFPPPPPLPLVLQQTRPPLRKKKSFSRISTWLSSAGEHTRDISIDSITNTPKPVTSREGFYQCLDSTAITHNASFTSISTVSTLESELDEPTVPTTWTPDSSPGRAPRNQKMELTRTTTFGGKEKQQGFIVAREFGDQIPHRISSVGVAF